MRYGYKSRLGLAKITAPWGTDDHSHPFLLKWIDGVKMDTVQDGTLAKQFTEKKGDGETEQPPDKLISVILCHGLTGSRTSQSGNCKDLASHGYLVFSLDHCDGTANYYCKKNGEERWWSSNHDLYDIDMRRK